MKLKIALAVVALALTVSVAWAPNYFVDSAGNIVTVGNIKMGDSGTRPTCAAAERGRIWLDFGATSVADDNSLCTKDSSDVYAWTSIAVQNAISGTGVDNRYALFDGTGTLEGGLLSDDGTNVQLISGALGLATAPIVGTRLTLPVEDDAATPTISVGPSFGIYSPLTGLLNFSTFGVPNIQFGTDLTMIGTGSIIANEIIADTTDPEALLVRKVGDGGDVFTVDTTNSRVILGIVPQTLTKMLNIVGDNPDVYLESTTTTDAKYLAAITNITDRSWAWGIDSSENDQFVIAFDTNLTVSLSADSKLSISTGGDVGIGVNGALIDLAIGDTDTGLEQVSDGILTVLTNNGERMRISATGQIAFPDLTLLDSNDRIVCFARTSGFVNGEINFSGDNTDCAPSSIRYKTNIENLNVGLKELMELQTVRFEYKSNVGLTRMGLIAEEVYETGLAELVNFNDDGEIESLKKHFLPIVIIKAVQEQQTQIEALARIVCLEHPGMSICA